MVGGVIFDLDGVLADTAGLHFESWRRALAPEGITVTEQMNERLRGRSRRRSLELLLDGRSLPAATFDRLLEEKNRSFHTLLDEPGAATLRPGMGPLLDRLEQAGIPMGVGSSSRNAGRVLEALGVRARFVTVVDGSRGLPDKPAPDIFLAAAREMERTPARCIVVEDAASGVAAALAGRFAVVGIGPARRVGRAHLRLDGGEILTLAHLREAAARAAGG